MSMNFYVSPDQLMKDRADYAQKGIARGRSLAAVTYDSGILLCAENPSVTLHKISEIYDRIAFAGVGKFTEYDQLRVAGIRHADLRGYAFSRQDVDARGLANSYAQYLGQAFIQEQKPMEVEILVVEIGEDRMQDSIFHIIYDGTINDKGDFSVVGGSPDAIQEYISENYKQDLTLPAALKLCVEALSTAQEEKLIAVNLEAAILDRTKTGRTFRRLTDDFVDDALKTSAS